MHQNLLGRQADYVLEALTAHADYSLPSPQIVAKLIVGSRLSARSGMPCIEEWGLLKSQVAISRSGVEKEYCIRTLHVIIHAQCLCMYRLPLKWVAHFWYTDNSNFAVSLSLQSVAGVTRDVNKTEAQDF